MCLYVNKNTRVRTVKRERTVYKIVGYTINNISNRKRKFTYYSPFQNEHLIKMRKSEILNENINIIDGFGVGNGFHTFQNIEDTKHYINNVRWFFKYQGFDGVRIVECKIPVGAQIVKGRFSGFSSYASTEIYYNKTVYTNKYN